MKIIAENLIKIYGDRSVVNDVSFEVNKGEVVGLLGPNGAGKTTTFYMIVGLVKANSGKVSLLDKNTNEAKDITLMPMNERAKLGIGYLPQEASIFRKLSVEDNLKLVLELNEKLDHKQKKEKLEELLEEFGMTRHRKARPYLFQGVKEEGWKLQEHLPPLRILSFWTNLLQELTLLQSGILKKTFINLQEKKDLEY